MKISKRIGLGIVCILVLALAAWVVFLSVRGQENEAASSITNGEVSTNLADQNSQTTQDPRTAALKAEKYFLERNLVRYQSYYDLHPDFTPTVVVRDVNANLDKTKYVDVKPADLSYGVLSMINKYNDLGEYQPEDLVDLGANYGSGHNMLRREAAEAFIKMAEAARADGLILRNISGYRSYAVQENLYASYSLRDGAALADTYSSRAGYSEHQAGLATDINSVDTDFQYTKEFGWLQEHAADYGFILRYPEGLEEITGFMYEPWHYRYVGVEPARQIVREGITFDEYYAYYVLGEKSEW